MKLELTGIMTAVLFVLAASVCVAAHPYHVSLAEVERNQKTGNLQVALCVWPADLEKAISRQSGEPVNLDEVEQLDRQLERFVREHFVVRDAEQNRMATIRWVGHELSLKQAWLYFEVKTSRIAQLSLENRVFLAMNDEQLNQVNFVSGKHRSTFSFTAKTPRQRLVEIVPSPR